MTNQQLAVVLMQLHGRFNSALTEAKAALPPEAHVLIKPLFGKGYTVVPALYGIQNSVNDLKKQADLLTTTQGA